MPAGRPSRGKSLYAVGRLDEVAKLTPLKLDGANLRNRNARAVGRACGQGLSVDRVGFRAVYCAAALRGCVARLDYRAAMQSSSTFAPNANPFAPKALRAGYGGVNAAL